MINVLVENLITTCSNELCRKVITSRDIEGVQPIIIDDSKRKGYRLRFYVVDYSEFSNINSLRIILFIENYQLPTNQ